MVNRRDFLAIALRLPMLVFLPAPALSCLLAGDGSAILLEDDGFILLSGETAWLPIVFRSGERLET
jgi:hypothetical protein